MRASAAGAADPKALLIAALGSMAVLGSVWLVFIARNLSKAPSTQAPKPAAVEAAAPPKPKVEAPEPGAEALMLLALLSMSTLTACNTVAGVGKDVEGAGDKIEDKAEDCKDDC